MDHCPCPGCFKISCASTRRTLPRKECLDYILLKFRPPLSPIDECQGGNAGSPSWRDPAKPGRSRYRTVGKTPLGACQSVDVASCRRPRCGERISPIPSHLTGATEGDLKGFGWNMTIGLRLAFHASRYLASVNSPLHDPATNRLGTNQRLA